MEGQGLVKANEDGGDVSSKIGDEEEGKRK